MDTSTKALLIGPEVNSVGPNSAEFVCSEENLSCSGEYAKLIHSIWGDGLDRRPKVVGRRSTTDLWFKVLRGCTCLSHLRSHQSPLQGQEMRPKNIVNKKALHISHSKLNMRFNIHKIYDFQWIILDSKTAFWRQ